MMVELSDWLVPTATAASWGTAGSGAGAHAVGTTVAASGRPGFHEAPIRPPRAPAW
ncbi:hypothetical protein I540_3511 [Mycobacteroides abscessus subsp. bolletii 1513]|uniref:Uncharacterized protein n=1 Tax=Mycobacteroides abscessus subsp. bolletii 1513 TaxID=1299321 RepID=X8DTH4_9MYCO|nr:hypothetical protein I540_3511 [Mycobacteroides abscessus subsp. bolletii 1513]